MTEYEGCWFGVICPSMCGVGVVGDARCLMLVSKLERGAGMAQRMPSALHDRDAVLAVSVGLATIDCV